MNIYLEQEGRTPGVLVQPSYKQRSQNERGWLDSPAVSPAPHLPESLVKEAQGPWGLVVQGWEANPRQGS